MPVNGINNINHTTQANQAASNTQQSTANAFASMLSTYMTMSAGSIGSFDNASSGSSMDGMMGMGGMGGSSSASGLGGDSSMMMMMLMMMMMNKNNGSSSGNALSGLLGNSGTSAVQSQCQHTYVNAYAQTASQGIPATSWLVSNPPLTNHIGERSAQTYRSVIDQFNVEGNERYRTNKNGTNDTYCNIFTWDVTRAMGAEIPHFVTSGGVPVEAAGAGAKELDANSVNDWLNTQGAQYGWRKATPEEAQAYANQGMPAVTSWKNPSGHGHLQVVSPSMNGTYDAQKGVAIAQAGRQLIDYGYATDSYGEGKLSEVEYFVHI